MPATDDPPFPLGGMKKIVADLAQVASQFQADESVTILVAISETGVATAVKIIGEPTLELAKAVAYVLVQARYKPAKCNGLPCAQEFPFRLHLTTR